MDGIISGKIEKNLNVIEFKTVKLWQIPDSRNYWFKDATSFQKSNYVKITTVIDERDRRSITLFYLPDIAPQTQGYSLWYGGYATDGMNIYYSGADNGLYLEAGYGYLSRYFETIEIGTLS